VLRRLADGLRRNVRGEDVVARWGGEEFVLGMYGLTREAGIERITALLEEFRAERFVADGEEFSLTFSAGVAQFPVDGQDIDTLYHAADHALYRAKASGRNQVAGASGKAPDRQELVDVAVVEDDDATGDVVTSALVDRGHTVRRYSGGASALADLAGSFPAVRPTVLLLDVEMPSVDGFAVLDQLRADGVLRNTKVLMLTGRADEDDVLRALEGGAFDHISKPFSVPVLLQKVQRALER
jgi:PleD family two-component response regulator